MFAAGTRDRSGARRRAREHRRADGAGVPPRTRRRALDRRRAGRATGALAPGQIRDSNRPMLLALARRRAPRPSTSGSRATTRTLIDVGARDAFDACDAVLTSGGVSVGDYDFVKAALDRLGALEWRQVAIKPAKPLAFGVVRGVPVFGLPGNPVSSLVSFELFARPALRQMMGHDRRAAAPRSWRVPRHTFRRRPDGKLHLDRVRVDVRRRRLRRREHRRAGRATCSRPPRRRTASPSSPTATASPLGDHVTVMLLCNNRSCGSRFRPAPSGPEPQDARPLTGRLIPRGSRPAPGCCHPRGPESRSPRKSRSRRWSPRPTRTRSHGRRCGRRCCRRPRSRGRRGGPSAETMPTVAIVIHVQRRRRELARALTSVEPMSSEDMAPALQGSDALCARKQNDRLPDENWGRFRLAPRRSRSDQLRPADQRLPEGRLGCLASTYCRAPSSERGQFNHGE